MCLGRLGAARSPEVAKAVRPIWESAVRRVMGLGLWGIGSENMGTSRFFKVNYSIQDLLGSRGSHFFSPLWSHIGIDLKNRGAEGVKK